MLRLEEITKGAAVSGLEPGEVVRIVATELIGEHTLTVYYKRPDGELRERMLFRTDEANLALAQAGRPWAFDAEGEDFKLAAEAWRINLAYLFDGKLPMVRHIEVKGPAKGQSIITVTRNEILYGLNQADKFILAIVLVDGEAFEGPYYVRNPFTQEPDWAVTSTNLDLAALLGKAVSAEACV